MEAEARAEESIARWEPIGAAEVDAAATEGCAEAPCVRIEGAGGASTAMLLNRGETYVLSGNITATEPLELKVVHIDSSGPQRTLLERLLPAGSSSLEESFSFTEPGPDVAVSIESPDGGAVVLDGFAVTGERWSRSGEPPGGLVRLGFLIHVEEDAKFLDDEATWMRRAHVLEGVSSTLGAHGAGLGMQLHASFVRGATQWQPNWIEAREAEGALWSLHIHDESGGAEGIEQAVRDGRMAHRAAGAAPVTDLNGGFLTAPWQAVRLAGITSLSAYKDPTTQGGLPRVQVQPWRPADGTGASDPEAFMVHDPEGPLLYLPGHDVREVEHARFPENAAQVLSQVLAHAREGWVNTWYFVLHVDGFGPVEDDAALDSYIADGGLAADLEPYDRFLEEVTDPLVEDGLLVYDTPGGMTRAWTEWIEACDE